MRAVPAHDAAPGERVAVEVLARRALARRADAEQVLERHVGVRRDGVRGRQHGRVGGRALDRHLSRATRRRFGSTRGPWRGSREARALQPPAESAPSSERTARPGAQVLVKRQLSPPVMAAALRIRPVLFLAGERARGAALCIRHRSFAAGQGFAAPSQVRAIRRAPPHRVRCGDFVTCVL